MTLESLFSSSKMRTGFLCFVLILFLSLRPSAGDDDGLVPMVELGKVKTMVVAEEFFRSGGRRRLNSFQVCSPCVCCSGAAGNSKYCLPSPCCYAINCNIPNRPFGFCSFTPKTCNCLQCHI